MEIEGTSARRAWCAAYPTPATEQQLNTLCELNGLAICLLPPIVEDEPIWQITDQDGEHVCRFWISSPIERFIARIAEWRREQI